MTDQTLKLAKPIQAHGETVDMLTFREPTGLDIAAAGVPFTLNADPVRGTIGSQFDAKVIHGLISSLAGIPPASVDKLSAADWMRAMIIVTSFFEDTIPPPSATPTSTSGGTGGTSAGSLN